MPGWAALLPCTKSRKNSGIACTASTCEVRFLRCRRRFLICATAAVITGSIGAALALPGNVVYAAAKAGLRAVARILAAELLPRRIRVNVVSPGPTETEIFKRGASPAQIAAVRSTLGGAVPMKRMGEPEEVARAVLFLASEEASFINGVDLHVDGGCLELGRR